VTKADIVDRIADGTGLTKTETEAVINGFMTIVKSALTEGESVYLRGFGTFKAQKRAARTARNPRTNQEVRVSERVLPVFKASQEFRDAVESRLDPQDIE
jgi:nucleoid DNA-binding protein